MKSGSADILKPVAVASPAADKHEARRAAVSAFVVWQRQRDTRRLTSPTMSRRQRAADRS
jgi:hypothetical protein